MLIHSSVKLGPTTSSATSARPMCDPKLRTPGTARSSLLAARGPPRPAPRPGAAGPGPQLLAGGQGGPAPRLQRGARFFHPVHEKVELPEVGQEVLPQKR